MTQIGLPRQAYSGGSLDSKAHIQAPELSAHLEEVGFSQYNPLLTGVKLKGISRGFNLTNKSKTF